MRRSAPPDLRHGEKVFVPNGTTGADGTVTATPNRAARRKRDRLEMRANARLKGRDPGYAERQRDLGLAIATGEMGKAIAGMAMRQALGPEVLEELRAAVAADPAGEQPHLEKFTAALARMADDDARARIRGLLPAFFGTPPQWLVDFVNGGTLEAARAAWQEGRLYGKGSVAIPAPGVVLDEATVDLTVAGVTFRSRPEDRTDGEHFEIVGEPEARLALEEGRLVDGHHRLKASR